MSNKTYEQQLKAIASRLRFIQRRIWDLKKDDSSVEDINKVVHELKDQIENYFGPKIAREIFWGVEEK